MKYLLVCSLILSVWLAGNPVFAGEQSYQSSKCEKCHGMPPLSASDPGSYNPGAHGVHRQIRCGECHVMNGEKHIDGIISLRQILNYSEGNRITWPGGGSGKCGGNNLLVATGCHQEKKDFECYWLPGRICKPTSTP